MNKLSWSKIYPVIVKLAWAFLFITLPVTSFPFFPPSLGGQTLVRPLAIYPLAVLVFLVTIPALFKRPIPKTVLPIFAFVVFAMIGSVLSFSSDIEALRGVTMASRLLRNLLTLALGLAFYLTVALLPKTWEELKFSLRWLYAGFGIALAWGMVQIPYVVHFSPKYFKLIGRIQSFISTRKLFNSRISGMTFEPKWFAEQICFLLLPWLLGSVLSRRTVFPWRYKWITVEMVLLAWASFVLLFTYSRTGVAILVVLVILSAILFRTVYWHKSQPQSSPVKRRGRRVLEIGAVVAVLFTVLIVVGSQNSYFSRLWRYFTEASQRHRSYLEYIAVEQRFVYWETALRTFTTHPMLGVGLGNYAFYFDEMLPNQPWSYQKEIIRQITPSEGQDRMITPKNLYAKLLAETGLLGTAAFTAFVFAMIGCVLFLLFSKSPEQRFWGTNGLLAMVVFVIVLFSFDSFALPNMWVVFGLITAAAHMPDLDGEVTSDSLAES